MNLYRNEENVGEIEKLAIGEQELMANQYGQAIPLLKGRKISFFSLHRPSPALGVKYTLRQGNEALLVDIESYKETGGMFLLFATASV